ncbi:MAG: nuclear transport factor 2 family protein [Acidobacteria bacterium]|nr:nuclear transport factor 2 family protein [Acidobacteriota bacterium]MBI3427315.1 nuclear transport factor 2 family protein [Acidobacteriota bacterium]
MSARSPELESIRTVIELYIDGVRTGNIESLRQAFHPQAAMFGWKGADLFVTPIQGLFDYVGATPAPANSGEPTKFIITSMQVAGNGATVELAMDAYHAHDFLDFFQLLKAEGRWWIVSKLFQADPQSA